METSVITKGLDVISLCKDAVKAKTKDDYLSIIKKIVIAFKSVLVAFGIKTIADIVGFGVASFLVTNVPFVLALTLVYCAYQYLRLKGKEDI